MKIEYPFLIGTFGLVLALVIMVGVSHATEPSRHIIFETVKTYYEDGLISESEYMQFLKYMEIDIGFSENHKIILDEKIEIADSSKARQEMSFGWCGTQAMCNGETNEKFAIWAPIPKEDHDNMAELFATALGDKIADREKIRDNEDATWYWTESGGGITLNTFPESVFGGWNAGIEYSTPQYVEPDKRKEIVYDFMDNMGFEYDKKDLKSQSLHNRMVYKFEDEKNSVEFYFKNAPRIGMGMDFNGYTNDPVPLNYVISKEDAFNKLVSLYPDGMKMWDECILQQYGNIDPNFKPETDVLEKSFLGEPYYYMNVGFCQTERMKTMGMHYSLIALIDATDGADSFYFVSGNEG